jgi:myo-inositol-1(or 4)-monophosphatase
LQENEADLALLISSAHAAGQIARRHFGDGPKSWDKGAGLGPVSEADLEVDAMLRERLLHARPDYGWLSEETTDHPARLGRKRVFIIDPIDGTRAFLDGQTGFAHALAVVDQGVPVAAVIHLPMLGHTYSAALGHGAYLGDTRLRVSEPRAVDGANVLAARPALAEANWPGGVPQVTRHFRPSLAWRMALVAEGRFDAMLTLRPTWHWDIAAGALLIAEAGGVVSTGRGAALLFNTAAPIADGVIAAGSALHAALMEHRLPATV